MILFDTQVLTKMKEQVDCMLSPLYQDSLNMITSVKVGRSWNKSKDDRFPAVQQRGDPLGRASQRPGADEEPHVQVELFQVLDIWDMKID